MQMWAIRGLLVAIAIRDRRRGCHATLGCMSVPIKGVDCLRQMRSAYGGGVQSDVADAGMRRGGVGAKQKHTEHSEECSDPANVALPACLHLPTSSSDS